MPWSHLFQTSTIKRHGGHFNSSHTQTNRQHWTPVSHRGHAASVHLTLLSIALLLQRLRFFSCFVSLSLSLSLSLSTPRSLLFSLEPSLQPLKDSVLPPGRSARSSHWGSMCCWTGWSPTLLLMWISWTDALSMRLDGEAHVETLSVNPVFIGQIHGWFRALPPCS